MATGLPGLTSDAIAASHFTIEIDGNEIAQFQEVGGITSEIGVIELNENTALGQPIVKKLPGPRKPPTITLKRGKNVSTQLWDWHYAMSQGKVVDARKNGSIVLFDFTHGEVARWDFYNAWPSKVTVSNLKAGSSDIVTEEVSMVCEDIKRVK